MYLLYTTAVFSRVLAALITGLCLNFHTLLKTIAILVKKCLPLPNLGLDLSKRHNLKFVKLEVARIHDFIDLQLHTCSYVVPVLKY